MRLSGQDLDETTTVLEAGLEWIVGWDKGDFVGRDALIAQRASGVSRKLVGFEMVGRGIARHGYPVFVDGESVGFVTSGTRTPFLEKAVGLAYLPISACAPGIECAIEIRGRLVVASVGALPFYRRESG